jgi:predicted DNA-binding protein
VFADLIDALAPVDRQPGFAGRHGANEALLYWKCISNLALRYYPSSCMSVLTCKLPQSLDGRLAELARRRGVPKSVLVREAIEAKLAEEATTPHRAANLIEALGDTVGSIASGKRDLARNKKHLRDYGR